MAEIKEINTEFMPEVEDGKPTPNYRQGIHLLHELNRQAHIAEKDMDRSLQTLRPAAVAFAEHLGSKGTAFIEAFENYADGLDSTFGLFNEPKLSRPGAPAIWETLGDRWTLKNDAASRKKNVKEAAANYTNAMSSLANKVHDLDHEFSNIFRIECNLVFDRLRYQRWSNSLTKPLKDYATKDWYSTGYSKEYQHLGAQETHRAKLSIDSGEERLALAWNLLEKHVNVGELAQNAEVFHRIYQDAYQAAGLTVKKDEAKRALAKAKKDQKWELQQQMANQQPIEVRAWEDAKGVFINHIELKQGLSGEVKIDGKTRKMARVGLLEIEGIKVPIKTFKAWLTAASMDPETGRQFKYREFEANEWQWMEVNTNIQLTQPQNNRHGESMGVLVLNIPRHGGLKSRTRFFDQEVTAAEPVHKVKIFGEIREWATERPRTNDRQVDLSLDHYTWG